MQRLLRLLLVASLALTGCHSPVAPPVSSDGPTLTIDAVHALDALGDRPNDLWQDNLFNLPAVNVRRAARYHVQTVTAANSWTSPATLPAVSTNGAAYAHDNSSGGNQPAHPDEIVYTVCDDAAGTVVRLQATTGTPVGTNFQALTGLVGAGIITHSAVGLSGNNDVLYLLSSGGYFVMLDAKTGTRLAAIRLSVSGFTHVAPFVDYSNGGGVGGTYNDENLYALATDGSLYRVEMLNGTVKVRGWRASGGTDALGLAAGLGTTSGTWPISNAGISAGLIYGTVPSPLVASPPIVWNGVAYFGGMNGKLYRVDTNTGTLNSITVSSYPITTTPAADFSSDFSRITDVFVPGGDRLHWIDASNATSLSRKAISPPLVLNTKPASGSSGASGKLSSYTYGGATSPLSFTATDWVAAATSSIPSNEGPTRWGGGTADLGDYNTVTAPYDIHYYGTDGSLWMTCPSDNMIRQFSPASGTITAAYDGNGNYAALVKTIPVGTDPAGLTPDPINGGVWVSNYGSNAIWQIDAAGNVVRKITGIPNPTGLCYDQSGTAGNASDDVIWVCSTTGSSASGASGSLYKVQVSDGTMTSYDNTNTEPTNYNSVWKKVGGKWQWVNTWVSGPLNYNAHSGVSNPSNNSPLLSTDWQFRGPQGVTVDPNGKVWVANTCENTSLIYQNGTSSNSGVYPFTIDGTGSTNGDDGISSDYSSMMVFDPSSAEFVARVVCTGSPYGLDIDTSGTTNSVWVGTYRWGRDVVERYDCSTFGMLYQSNQTSNHWQPRWVAVDQANNHTWVVNGNSSWPDPNVATNGLDCIKANGTGSGSMSSGNSNFIGTYQTGAQPRGVDTDSAGNVWVSNSVVKTCTKYSASGSPLGTYPVGNTPYAVACDKFDVTWVANLTDNTVSRLTPTTLPPAPLSQPRGFALTSAGDMWIANAGNNTMTVLNQTGNTTQLALSTDSTPYGVANGSGKVFVAPSGSTNIDLFNSVSGALSTAASSAKNFWVATDASGNAFMTTPSSNKVTMLNAAGAVTTSVAVGTNPQGVGVNQTTGDAWIADKGSAKVSYLKSGTSAVTSYTVGNGPSGAAAQGNQVWVANTTDNTITRLNAVTGGTRTAVGTSLGTVSGYAGANAPINMAIDANDDLWVANSGAAWLTKIWFAGAQDLMAASNYLATDAKGSYAYVHFLLAPGALGGHTPVSTSLKLTANSNSALNNETLAVSLAGETAGGVQWKGYASTPNVDWNASPAIGSAAGSLTTPVTSGNSYSVPLAENANLIDTSNTSYDSSNGLLTYAFQSSGASLENVAHWSTSGSTKPQLVVNVTNTALGATGLCSQPLIGYSKHVFVMGTNAIFELSYDTAAHFSDPTQIAYSYTSSGISQGPLNGTTYITPTGCTAEDETGRLITFDYNPVSNTSGLNCYHLGGMSGGFFLDTSGNNTTQLARTASIPGTVTNSQLIFDYDYGSVYLASGNAVYAIKLLQ
ncbi:MAG TPA: PQQ-binding-like beta-propeller repeat protein [Oscillatoriaceae cyanobacterium]